MENCLDRHIHIEARLGLNYLGTVIDHAGLAGDELGSLFWPSAESDLEWRNKKMATFF